MLFEPIQAMAKVIPKAMVLYSCGADSTVMLDLFAKYWPADRVTVINLYTVPDLSYRLDLFSKIKARYGFDVIQEPSFEVAYCLKKAGKKVKLVTMGEQIIALRQKYNVDFLAYGMLRSDSMARALMLKQADENCIDWRYKKLYPVANWRKTFIHDYIKKNKLLLSTETYAGYRNIDVFKDNTALWLKNNYPEDFARACELYPYLEGEIIRVSQ